MSALVLAIRVCGKCQQSKPASAFYRSPSSPCKECVSVYQRERRARKKAELGERVWLDAMNGVTRRSRKTRGYERERWYSRARAMAVSRLIDLHRQEFDAIFAAVKYDFGKEAMAGRVPTLDAVGTNNRNGRMTRA